MHRVAFTLEKINEMLSGVNCIEDNYVRHFSVKTWSRFRLLMHHTRLIIYAYGTRCPNGDEKEIGPGENRIPHEKAVGRITCMQCSLQSGMLVPFSPFHF